MSRFADMKQAAGQSEPTVPFVKPPGKKKMEKPDHGPTITHSCGHARPIKFHTGEPCSQCRGQARKKYQQKQAAKRAEQKVQQDRTAAGRLPAGSRFEVFYVAEKMEWHGYLDVPGLERFHGSASAVFKLLSALDGKYREYAATTEG